jgi:Macrocin-O-methyltransferase (TylF)
VKSENGEQALAKRSLTERLVRRVYYKYFARNLLYELQMRARAEAADYAQAYMTDALIFEKCGALLQFCLNEAPAGAILEFGVAGGGTINQIARHAKGRPVHGFDSFEGLPEHWSGHLTMRGAFNQGGKLPQVPPDVTLHKGWFDATLPVWKATHRDRIGFLHVDCDIYSATRFVLANLADRFQVGTVIRFDEYFNYPNWRKHEFRAWQETVAELELKYEYIGFQAQDGAVAVRVTDLGRVTAAG